MSLILGVAQVEQLSERRFQGRLAEILGDSDSAAQNAFASPEGRDALRKQCAKARSFGMTSELDIARYVITAWQLGLDFDTRFPAMAEILNADRLTSSQKAVAIERVCTAVMGELRKGRA